LKSPTQITQSNFFYSFPIGATEFFAVLLSTSQSSSSFSMVLKSWFLLSTLPYIAAKWQLMHIIDVLPRLKLTPTPPLLPRKFPNPVAT